MGFPKFDDTGPVSACHTHGMGSKTFIWLSVTVLCSNRFKKKNKKKRVVWRVYMQSLISPIPMAAASGDIRNQEQAGL